MRMAGRRDFSFGVLCPILSYHTASDNYGGIESSAKATTSLWHFVTGFNPDARDGCACVGMPLPPFIH